MAQERTFTLIGNFTDNISPSLKKINKSLGEMSELLKDISKLSQSKGKNSFVEGFKAANEELKTLSSSLKDLNKHKFNFDRTGIQAAQQDVRTLGKDIDQVAQKGFAFDRSGIKAAQEDAKVLGQILEANALIQVGEGFANALTAGAHSAINILSKGAGFFGKQYTSAVEDQMEDLQARGSLYGSLTKAGLLKGGDAGQMADDYRQTKLISRANESAIGDLIRTSSVSTSVVTTLNRQMTDNLLPTLLKARNISSLSGLSRDEMDKLFGGEKGIGKELARIYEQIATVTPSPAYASVSAMGFTQAITSGTVNRQLAIFENNPVLVDALKTIDGGIQGTADIGKRIEILRKALEVAAPTMMLDEMKQTIGGGMQAVQDTIMNPTVGILSLGADIANEGQKTLEQYKRTGAYQLQMERVRANLEKLALKRGLEGEARLDFISKYSKQAEEKLVDAITSADSPIEKISVGLAPVLQSVAGFLNTFGNLFLGPVTSALEALYKPLAAFQRTLDYLSTDIELFNKTQGKQGRSIGNALGRAVGEFFKAIASYFNPDKAGKEIGNGITRFFRDFMEGFESIDGKKWLGMVLDTLKDIFFRLIFNEGNILKGITPLGNGLALVFATLAAPAVINALVAGLIPLALQGMGTLVKKSLSSLAEKIPSLVRKSGAESVPGLTPSERLSGKSPRLVPSPRQGFGNALKTLFIKPLQLSPLKTGFNSLLQSIKNLPALFMRFHANIRAGLSGFAGFGNPLKSLTGGFSKFGGLLQKGVRGLGKFGMGLTIVVAAFDLISNLLSGKDLASSLGAAAGPAFGTILGFALGGPIGAMIGGWLGGQKPVVDIFSGMFTGIEDTFGPAMEGLGSIVQTVSGRFGDIGYILQSIFPDLAGVTQGIDAFQVGVALINIALFPLTGTIAAVDQTFIALRLASLHFVRWISTLPVIGDKAGKTAEWDKKIAEADSQARAAVSRYEKMFSPEVFLGFKASADRAAQSLDKLSPKPSAASPEAQLTAAASPAVTPTAPAEVSSSLFDISTNAKTASDSLFKIPPSSESASQANIFLARTTSTGAERVKTSLADQIASYKKITSSWEKSNVSSQTRLSSSAMSFSAALNSAASKIRAASASPTGPGGGITAAGQWDGKDRKPVAINEAIAQEQRHMPSGAHLVIANSSETIIPANQTSKVLNAADGINLEGMASGLDKLTSKMNAIGKMADELNNLGGGKGSLAIAHAWARKFGLQLTSYIRSGPASASYHNTGRAMDFSNSSGPTPEMMAYAKFMARYYGKSMTELIHTPLGFGIKHGVRTAPYAASTHYDHVHVAFGMGPNNPTYFSSASQARAWERKVAPTSAKVATVTTNSAERFGGPTLNAPITIYQQPYQDSEELAALVAMRIGMALEESRNHS